MKYLIWIYFLNLQLFIISFIHNIDFPLDNLAHAMAFGETHKDNKKTGSFRVVLREFPIEDSGTHFQPEFQISLVLHGRGGLKISQHEYQLDSGDLFMLGPDLPHAMRHLSCVDDSLLQMISIYFLPEAFGKDFFTLPEMSEIQQMLKMSSKGIMWKGQKKFQPIILSLKENHAAKRLIQLLGLLHTLAHKPSYTTLSDISFSPEIVTADNSFSKILQYIYQNFDQPIKLEDMAELVNLNKYSFCRYFKRMTQMSFVSYLNEFRISKACSFLSSDTYNISQIGYLVGFNTLSNFYKQFQKVMNCTPTEYREELE